MCNPLIRWRCRNGFHRADAKDSRSDNFARRMGFDQTTCRDCAIELTRLPRGPWRPTSARYAPLTSLPPVGSPR